ncbi:MAG TPA: histidine triad nucleotide-binding protein [Burkholderiales bacterium]|jgi:histidine triad (HIT) family protein|nr:histidine triad nucleotide-binding protein [Burkholderiales bacterium]
MADTLFAKIIDRQIPADIVYEDDLCLAFRDVNPQAPVHVLLVPKKPLDMLSNAGAEDEALLGHMLFAAGKIARELKIDGAFRLVINNGKEGGQAVFHLHMHIMAGRKFRWPPG